MAEAVVEARKEGGVKVLIGGACSSANTRDKLFCDGTDTFLPWLDFVSIHYQPLAADPLLEPNWMNRKGEYGRVRVWDTESWVANSDDRVAGVIASMRAMGQDRTAGIYAGNVFTSEKPRIERQGICRGPGLGPRRGRGRHASISSASATSRRSSSRTACLGCLSSTACGKKVGGERSGPCDPDDGTVVITGDLSASYDKQPVPFPFGGAGHRRPAGTARRRRPVHAL